jgi:hypothetical protein
MEWRVVLLIWRGSALGWEEVRQDGFFCAASGCRFRNTLKLLQPVPRAWINHEKSDLFILS